jgi:N-acyl-D-aspartate/D-glutamate deacylase
VLGGTIVAFDLVIRGGTVVDGTGAPERTADVAVRDGIIVEVGEVAGKGSREINADGALVTPGWVDVHTHYDAQVTWESRLAPSSWNGVTTAVMGNCGVGFAPVHDSDHDLLIEIMEGVEDIPGTALHEGLTWGWNSYAEYLDAADKIPHDIDFGAYVPHNPLRVFVMGARGAQRGEATEEDILEMGRLAKAGIEAGALGFSTANLDVHKTSRGDHTPAYGATAEECVGIAKIAGESGLGVLQIAADFDDMDDEFAVLTAMAEASGMPTSFTLSYRYDDVQRKRLDALLSHIEVANASGLSIMGQVAPRAIGLLYGLECSMHPFVTNPVYKEIADLPLSARVAIMQRPDFKERILANQTDEIDFRTGGRRLYAWEIMYSLSDPPDYEPDPSQSIEARAQRERRDPAEIAYDVLTSGDGKDMLYLPTVNYREGNLDFVRELLLHPHTLPGLSDGGAHVRTVCDASFPTTLLAYWGHRRNHDRIDVPFLVKRQCRDTADFVGLKDRGQLSPAYRADINVIDLDNLSARRPEFVYDLPAGGRRLMQKADGYLHTIVKGVSVYEDGIATGALPGRLVRGRQTAPAL